MNYAARRITKGAKKIVEVYRNGELVAKLGGNRAARATVVIVTHWPRNNTLQRDIENEAPTCELRANAVAAASESARYTSGRTGRYGPLPVADFSAAITITEAS